MALLGHVIGWTVLGAVADFIHGWRRLPFSTDRARAGGEGAPATDDAAWRHASGHQREYRLAAASVNAGLGAVAGLVVGLLTGGLAASLDVPVW
jgi:hypothetical protein